MGIIAMDRQGEYSPIMSPSEFARSAFADCAGFWRVWVKPAVAPIEQNNENGPRNRNSAGPDLDGDPPSPCDTVAVQVEPVPLPAKCATKSARKPRAPKNACEGVPKSAAKASPSDTKISDGGTEAHEDEASSRLVQSVVETRECEAVVSPRPENTEQVAPVEDGNVSIGNKAACEPSESQPGLDAEQAAEGEQESHATVPAPAEPIQDCSAFEKHSDGPEVKAAEGQSDGLAEQGAERPTKTASLPAERGNEEAHRRLAIIEEFEACVASGEKRWNAAARIGGQRGVSAQTIFNWLQAIQGVEASERIEHLTPKRRARTTSADIKQAAPKTEEPRAALPDAAEPELPTRVPHNGSGPVDRPTLLTDPLSVRTSPKPIGSNWIANRFEQIAAVTAFLKTMNIAVEVVDRSAEIKRYRVSSNGMQPIYHEEVIEIAMDLGWEG